MDRTAMLHQLEREVGVLVRRTRRVVTERAASIHPDLTAPGYLMLSYLNVNGPSRASAIAETFHLDKGAVSRNVHHLLELGLITKSADPADGRAQVITASEQAVARLHEINHDRLAKLDSRLGAWDSSTLQEFVDSFHRYNDLLGA